LSPFHPLVFPSASIGFYLCPMTPEVPLVLSRLFFQPDAFAVPFSLQQCLFRSTMGLFGPSGAGFLGCLPTSHLLVLVRFEPLFLVLFLLLVVFQRVGRGPI